MNNVGQSGSLEPILSPTLTAMRKIGLKHGFFTRQGGCSNGLYKDLNVGLGSADVKEKVIANRQLIANHLGVAAKNLISVHQCHSADVCVISADTASLAVKADALVTNQKNLALSILTADCGPVLLADSAAGVIGAAHAGWRGALNGVLENTISEMIKLGAQRTMIKAVLGPAIGPQCYEVTFAFRDKFVKTDATYQRYFLELDKPQHYLFNLWSFIVDRLKNAEIHATCIARCTYSEGDNFFSYRRAMHAGQPDYGRQMSAIVLSDD